MAKCCKVTLAEARKFLANDDQLCYARVGELAEGTGRGQRIVDVFNGTGLAFTVTPDRAMNVVECSFNGIPLVFRTPGGHRHAVEGDFLRGWTGGLFTTCGLRNAGSPSGGEGLHGRISTEAAEMLSVTRSDEGVLKVSGTIREGLLFGPNLVLKRTITTAFGDNRIVVEDEVTNRAAKPEYVEVIYHSNFGYPLVCPDTEFECPEHKVEARDDWAEEHLAQWQQFDAPVPGFREMCYRHFLPAGADGLARMRVLNRKLGIAVTVAYDIRTLPLIVQWKNCGANEYVLGLEPSAASLNGREADIASGMMPKLEPGERIKFHVEYLFEEV